MQATQRPQRPGRQPRCPQLVVLQQQVAQASHAMQPGRLHPADAVAAQVQHGQGAGQASGHSSQLVVGQVQVLKAVQLAGGRERASVGLGTQNGGQGDLEGRELRRGPGSCKLEIPTWE